MHDTLVIRFGSLGDLCLLGWSLARLADRGGASRPRVTLVTKAVFGPLMLGMRGVDAVEVFGGEDDSLRGLAARLRRRPWRRVLDAHAVLRSDLLQLLMKRRADRRLDKDTLARWRMLMAARVGRGPGRDLRSGSVRTMGERFDAVLAAATVASPGAGEPAARPPLDDRPRVDEPDAPLGVAPGAQWPTKRWPTGSFAELMRSYRERSDRRIRLFLGPREEAWFAGSELERIAATVAGVDVVRSASLVATAEQLAGCRHLVTNDSGLLHLAEAVGTPVLALFGPTVRGFGYYPRLPASRVLETPLGCRPCSRNGKRACRRGDQACLTRLAPADVLAALTTLEAAP